VGWLDEIPIAFGVTRVLDVSLNNGGLGGITLTEMPVDEPWVKDYDAVHDEGPSRWADQFNVSNWGLLTAHDANRLIGGAVVAYDTPGVDMLEGRSDLAVLWDIRVADNVRSRGVGTRLFSAAAEWAQSRGCSSLKIETQNINVPACRFYARMGCTLGAINRFAYTDLPDEVQLVWYRQL
jgi:GNAT superfamily N-acetyltransferase